MNQFESGSLVAIADVPEDLAGKVVQGQPVRIVQTYIGNDAEVLVAGLNQKEYIVPVENLCSLEDSCKARAARWCLYNNGTHKESMDAYNSVVEDGILDGLIVWEIVEAIGVDDLGILMKDLKNSLLHQYNFA